MLWHIIFLGASRVFVLSNWTTTTKKTETKIIMIQYNFEIYFVNFFSFNRMNTKNSWKKLSVPLNLYNNRFFFAFHWKNIAASLWIVCRGRFWVFSIALHGILFFISFLNEIHWLHSNSQIDRMIFLFNAYRLWSIWMGRKKTFTCEKSFNFCYDSSLMQKKITLIYSFSIFSW